VYGKGTEKKMGQIRRLVQRGWPVNNLDLKAQTGKVGGDWWPLWGWARLTETI
jgi:hypothetical protein